MGKGKIAVPTERAVRILLPFAKEREEECVWTMPLDGTGRLHGPPIETVLCGSPRAGEATFSMVEIFRPAVIRRAVYLYVAHNHPGGSLDPSRADVTSTAKMIRAARVLDIILLDHIIIVPNGMFTSLKERCQDRLHFAT